MNTKTYQERRTLLRKNTEQGNIILLSSNFVPRNYAANTYPFHQESSFLYYTGLMCSGAALWIDEHGAETLFYEPEDPDDVIWTGPRPSPEDLAAQSGIARCLPITELKGHIRSSKRVHFLPPFDFQHKVQLQSLLELPVGELCSHASTSLVRAVIAQRSVKSAEEIAELEEAIGVTKLMLKNAQSVIAPGKLETEIAAALVLPAQARNRQQSFAPIVTIHGETLHNEPQSRPVAAGDILLIDCGCESPLGYCADITRSYPVSGKFSSKQQAIYDIVLEAQRRAIEESAKPQASQRDLHFAASTAITEGLKSVGLMKGNVSDAVQNGAHALFMPHGIGHMLGIDVHDMENLGDEVGYEIGEKRSTQFGLNALRLAKELRPGFVFTVEPGIYFIPELIRRWEADQHLAEFICYDKLAEYLDFGGIRIEDDVVKTETGSRVLGPGIEK